MDTAGYVIHRTAQGTEIHLDPDRLRRLAGCAAAFNGLGAIFIGGVFVAWAFLTAVDAPLLFLLPVGVLAVLLWVAWWVGRKNYRRVMKGGSPTLVVESSGRVTFGGEEVVPAGAALAVRVEPREVSDGEGGTTTQYVVVVVTAGGAVAIKAVDSWTWMGLAYVDWSDSLADLPGAASFATQMANLLDVGVEAAPSKAGGDVSPRRPASGRSSFMRSADCLPAWFLI